MVRGEGIVRGENGVVNEGIGKMRNKREKRQTGGMAMRGVERKMVKGEGKVRGENRLI